MKTTNSLIIVIVLFVHPLFSQQQDTLYLSEIDSMTIQLLNNQGLRLFKNSDCIKKDEEYFTIPEFLVRSKVPLEELKFNNSEELISKLSVLRKSEKKLLNEIRWTVFLKRNTCVQSSSDFKKFYCYSLDTRFIDIQKDNRINIKNVLYLFHFYNVDFSLSFIVTNGNEIFVHLNKSRELIPLNKFNSLYENGEIEHFSDNPFKN